MDSPFDRDYPLEEGIYRTLKETPKVPLGQATNFLPLTAKVYEPLWRGRSVRLISGGSFSTERELKLMLAWLSPFRGERVLDAACSAGLYARLFLTSDPSLEVHALDFSLPFLKVAKSYAERDGVKPVLVHADVNALPYLNDSFDRIACGGSLNEFLDLPKALSEFARVLRPGGLMWQMYALKSEEPLGQVLQAVIRASGIRFIDQGELETRAGAVGLRLVRAQYRGGIGLALFRYEP